MAEKFMEQVAGRVRENEGLVSSAGAADAGKIPALDANGQLDPTLMPTGVAPDVISLASFEDLVAGDYVNVFDDSGTIKARKAVATDASRDANGFVVDNVTAPAVVNVFFEGRNNAANGTFAGGLIAYLSATAGQVTNTAPVAAGSIVQRLGKCLSSSAVSTEVAQPIELA